jgi:hypothetical protein
LPYSEALANHVVHVLGRGLAELLPSGLTVLVSGATLTVMRASGGAVEVNVKHILDASAEVTALAMAVRVVLESAQDFVIEELHHGWPGTRSVSSGHALPLAYVDWADNLLRSDFALVARGAGPEKDDYRTCRRPLFRWQAGVSIHADETVAKGELRAPSPAVRSLSQSASSGREAASDPG